MVQHLSRIQICNYVRNHFYFYLLFTIYYFTIYFYLKFIAVSVMYTITT